MLYIIGAYIADMLFGDPTWFPHPVRIIGKYITGFEKLVRRVFSGGLSLKLAGIALATTAVVFTYLFAYILLKYAQTVNAYFYYGLNILFLYTCLAARCLADEGMKIKRILSEGSIEEARKQLSYIVGRDTEHLDESQITKAAVETISENTSDGIIAPLFYMFISGAPLALAYKAINTLDSMVGYKNEKYLDFGWASARLDDLANYIPSRITAFLMVASAFILSFDYKASASILKRDCKKHKSPNSGYPEAATAGALGVQLGGTNNYFGAPVYKPTIGDYKRPMEKADIDRAIKLMYTTEVLAIILFYAAAFILGRIL